MIGIIKQFKSLLNRAQKVRLIIIFFMMLIGAVLETLSVSMIIPLVSSIMDPDLLENNKYIRDICKIFDLHSVNTFVILLIGALIILFILKNIFLYLEYYVQYRFVYNNRFATQRKLMETYLHRPYEYFLHASTGEVMRVVGNDTGVAYGLLTTLLSFFTEAVVSTMLVLMLFIVDPLMTIIVAAILAVVMLIIAKIVKPILRKAGLSLQKNVAQSNKWLLQSIAGIKEIKVSRKEEFFINQYAKYGLKGIDAEKKNSVLGNVPRLMIEAVSVSGMLAVIAIMIFRGRELSSMIPQLSAFAMAAVRLMPSANRLSAAYNTISYQEPFLNKLIENLKAAGEWEKQGEKHTEKENKEKPVSIYLRESIELSHVTYTYPESKEAVFKEANMVIPAGKSVGIVGVSGAGKTTAVDILLGLLKPSEGQVLADGISIFENYPGWLSLISYIPQSIYLLDDTIRANVAFGFPAKEISDELVWKALKEAKLDDFVKSLPGGLASEIGERGVRLSGGQRQRIGIARALYPDPELLIFDEATSALDNETEAAIMESINSLHGKKTMIIIAHRLGTIEGCDMVYRVENGRISRER